MKNVLVIFNPNAGRKKAVKYRKKIQKFLLADVESFKFVDLEQFENIDIKSFDTLIAAGGDGTVSKVARKIVYTDKVLGIIPCGTANLFAANLGINTNINEALAVIKANNIIKTDTININGVHYILRTGFGFDCNIISKTPQSIKNKFGYFAYFIAGILFSLRLKYKEYKFTTGGKEYIENASCFIVSNASNMFENVCRVGINSKVNDGYFDIFILKAKRPTRFFVEFLKIILNAQKTNKYVTYISAASLTIKSDLINCHSDGEANKFKGDINFNIAPESLNVFSK